MGNPVTNEVCEVCEKPFQLPMMLGRGCGCGWGEGDANMSYTYGGDNVEDCVYGVVCEGCISIISNRIRVAIHEIKGNREVAAKRREAKSGKV